MKTEYKNILEEIKTLYDFTDEELLAFDVIMGTAISLKTSRPNWVQIIAPPSSGKTQLLNLLDHIPKKHSIGNLTAKYLFSGHENAKGGFMKNKVGGEGILIFQDFTTVLSLPSKERSIIYNQLRTIFDGKSSLGTGLNSDSANEWKGKVAVLSSVTESIERIKDKHTDLGERFLYYYFNPSVKDDFLPFESADKPIKIKRLKQNVRQLYHESKNKVNSISLSSELVELIRNCAKFISWVRTTVERNGYQRHIEFVHQKEKPYRTFEMISNLAKSILALNGSEDRTQKVIGMIASSSVPRKRMLVIGHIFRANNSVDIDYLTKKMKISSTTIRRITEDLVALDILKVENIGDEKAPHYAYNFTKEFRKLLDSLN